MKYTYSLLSLVLLGVGVLFLAGCDHDTETIDGPLLVDRFGDFSLIEGLTIDRETVDFSAGEVVTFRARFNKQLDWIVKITGQETGAVKIIEGFSNELDMDNAVWEGGTTDLPLFGLEECQVELIIPEEDSLTQTGMVEIVGTRRYEGKLFTSFESDLGSNLFFGNFEFELTGNTGRRNDRPAGEGEWYYFFEGTDNVVANFFVGLVDISSQVTGSNYIEMPTTDPDDLYFNAFLYADGSPHGIAVIQFIYDSNDTGAFEDGQDQAFQLAGDFPLDFSGWKQISHSMGELGMTEEQVSKIVAIRLLLISNMNSQPNPPIPVDYGIDFLIFTEGAPLEI